MRVLEFNVRGGEGWGRDIGGADGEGVRGVFLKRRRRGVGEIHCGGGGGADGGGGLEVEAGGGGWAHGVDGGVVVVRGEVDEGLFAGLREGPCWGELGPFRGGSCLVGLEDWGTWASDLS